VPHQFCPFLDLAFAMNRTVRVGRFKYQRNYLPRRVYVLSFLYKFAFDLSRAI